MEHVCVASKFVGISYGISSLKSVTAWAGFDAPGWCRAGGAVGVYRCGSNKPSLFHLKRPLTLLKFSSMPPPAPPPAPPSPAPLSPRRHDAQSRSFKTWQSWPRRRVAPFLASTRLPLPTPSARTHVVMSYHTFTISFVPACYASPGHCNLPALLVLRPPPPFSDENPI